MLKIPLEPGYGPTLGQLLAPRWHAAGRIGRVVAILLGTGALALAVGAVLSLLNASFSHGGRVPFGFSYRGLYRTEPDPGGWVKVARRSRGRLLDSYAVAPLRLPPYSGNVSGELPLFAAGYAQMLARRFAGFRMEGEGRTRITPSMTGYHLVYSATVQGRKLSGRDVLMLPERLGAREGVAIEMLSAEPASVSKPVASSGVLERPLKTFGFR